MGLCASVVYAISASRLSGFEWKINKYTALRRPRVRERVTEGERVG